MIKLENLPYPVLILGHLILAILTVTIPFLGYVTLYGMLGYFLIRIISNQDRGNEALLAACYFASYEVLLRMTDVLYFYEMIKYLVLIFMFIGIIFKGFSIKSLPYVIYLLLMVPSIVVASQNIPLGESLRKAVAFNLTGPFTLGVVAIYCYQRRIMVSQLDAILKLSVGPIAMLTMHLFLVTPDIQDVLTGTGSNFATSGGYGPNQVSTALGIGMFLCFARFLRVRNFWYNCIDIVLLIGMTYRAWVTFSRGGVYTAAMMIGVTILVLALFNRSQFRWAFLPKIAVMVIGLALTWGFTSLVTEGLIDKRYANQDAAGRAKEDLSTGRGELATLEFQAFIENPIVGIGAGQSKYYRAQRTGSLAASHNETSRLLSEHGVIGILSILILVFTPLIYRLSHRRNIYFYAFLIFWFATINHSAMRIAAPSFFYGLALLNVVPDKKKVKRSLGKWAKYPRLLQIKRQQEQKALA
ncbi:O-antigen ligase family protein [Nonlabens ponticola]|uniref:O-antigen ligase domain-containing protein n=1 Tax=Nonlabens ponticola TaxID=2496866 RepID=A0A3S9MXL9_9FLAO|nr:O-antigen ligase family protein [Nonlabens ponticola]AZQ43882.1 O-antigen ligase domain-containing protein [Nonlabens ponticola]